MTFVAVDGFSWGTYIWHLMVNFYLSCLDVPTDSYLHEKNNMPP